MEFDRIHAPHAAFDDPTSRGDVALPRNRMWSHRFRKKWNMVLGKVPARDFMSTIAITEKVVYGSGLFCWECSKLCFLQKGFVVQVVAHAMTGSR